MDLAVVVIALWMSATVIKPRWIAWIRWKIKRSGRGLWPIDGSSISGCTVRLRKVRSIAALMVHLMIRTMRLGFPTRRRFETTPHAGSKLRPIEIHSFHKTEVNMKDFVNPFQFCMCNYSKPGQKLPPPWNLPP